MLHVLFFYFFFLLQIDYYKPRMNHLYIPTRQKLRNSRNFENTLHGLYFLKFDFHFYIFSHFFEL